MHFGALKRTEPASLRIGKSDCVLEEAFHSQIVSALLLCVNKLLRLGKGSGQGLPLRSGLASLPDIRSTPALPIIAGENGRTTPKRRHERTLRAPSTPIVTNVGFCLRASIGVERLRAAANVGNVARNASSLRCKSSVRNSEVLLPCSRALVHEELQSGVPTRSGRILRAGDREEVT